MKNRQVFIRSSIYLAALMVTIFLAGDVSFAAKGGNKGKPGDEGGGGGDNCSADALYPALIYPVDSGEGNGTKDLVVASSDGCVEFTVEFGLQLGGVRLKYDEETGSGYYAWAENVYPGYAPGTIRRQHFTVTDGDLTKTPTFEDLYQGVDYLGTFDLQGDLLAVVDDHTGEQTLLVIDLSTCDGLPCDGNDAVSVYTPDATSLHCLPDAVGCFQPTDNLTMALYGTEIYFDVLGQDVDGNGIHGGIARVTKGEVDWAPQKPEMFLPPDGSTYYEAGVLGLSKNDRFLAIRYLAGFQNRLRDDRVIIFDTDLTGESCPCEAADFEQDFSAWTATWTQEDTFYVLGTEGKRRNLRHPIEEFDPATGERRSVGISLEDHPRLDSSL